MSEPAEDVVLFARQPIFESSGRVFGYELLFRRSDGTGWPIGDEARATAHVVTAAFADLGLSAVTSGAKAWLNIPKQFLLETDVSVLPKQRIVLEILERDPVDAAMVARAQQLAREGYEVALDDFEWRDELLPLVECASYIKLDIQALGIAGVAEHVRRLGTHDVRLLAEKVETAAEREACGRLGISLYQGYFFERPRLIRGRSAPHQQIAGLQRAARLGPNASFEDIETILRLDPGLSVQLLRFVNSAAVSLRHRVTSLRQTLMLVGANTVRQWLLLVLMADIGGARPAVLASGLVRARLCETLAGDFRCKPDAAFIVGLLSICDALFDRPLDEVVADLPLADDLRDAIARREGPLGRLLTHAITVQRGAEGAGGRTDRALYDAVRWADAQIASLTTGAAAA